jgi:hypothetical protein
MVVMLPPSEGVSLPLSQQRVTIEKEERVVV